MATGLLEAGRQLNRARWIITQEHRFHQRPPQREGARFVEHHPLDLSRTLDHITTTEEPALAGCQPRRHGDHRGGRQTKRTGASHHEHRDRQLQTQPEWRLGSGTKGLMNAMPMAMVHQHHRNIQNLRPQAAADQPPEQKGEQRQ